MERLSGVVERITYTNEENGYTVARVKSKGYHELVTIVGNLATINVGAAVTMEGQWKNDSKYGRQFQVERYHETVPATLAGIEKYLGSGLIKGIGPVYARKIVRKFRDQTIDIIDEDPDRLIEVEGIGEKRVEMIKKAWQDQKEIKNVMLFLQSHGVAPGYAAKIYKTYKNDSIDIVQENPYRLADDIWGIGFKTADRIAEKLGFNRNAPQRCRSGILYVLNELSNEGHCFASREQLVEETIKILELEKDSIEEAIDGMVEDQKLIRDYGDCLYLPPFYHSEKGTARRIQDILKGGSPFHLSSMEAFIEQIQKENGILYDEVQKDAIRKAVGSKFMVLTGGPGTGKTTTTLGIIQAFKKMGATIALAAPTGRAAKRMTEATGMTAKTIHRLLEYKPPQGYMRNAENNPLECNVLIIDESSMVDIVLMYNLLKAVPDSCVVILVGDVDQLPSVGAGNVLRDIIESGAVDVVKLTRIFRQAQGSMIITNAHRINKGDFPNIRSKRDGDFFFIEEEDAEKIADTIRELVSKRLPAYYKVDPINDIQVLCPMQRGNTGAFQLNTVLQEALNPQIQSVKYGGTQYRLGDKVMQIKNNYDKNVFNGDIGRIAAIDAEDKTVAIRFDENVVEYDVTELDEVVLSYATTIHKSQGSEYKVVVAPLSTQHFIMLQRNLLYTCVTRAKKIMVLVGSVKAIAMAVKNNKITQRNTMLAKIIAPVPYASAPTP